MHGRRTLQDGRASVVAVDALDQLADDLGMHQNIVIVIHTPWEQNLESGCNEDGIIGRSADQGADGF